ncbi:hypothetical protein ACFX1Q_003841 [Malus domestica]
MTDSITAATPQSSPPAASIGIEISPNPVPIASVTIQERNKGGWWNELLDREEAKKQVVLSLPLILTNVCYYLIPVVSVMFAGHLGELELAAANLANSWATVTGFAFMVGLIGALETLCGQGFGAKLYRMGAPLAASISIWISMLMLATYVKRAKKFERTWEGFSFESFHYVLMDLKLALPFAAMVCLEYWAFEILVFLAGVMPNAKQITSLIAMCVNTEAIAYMITYGLSAAASTRVSNELGAGNPEKAKKAMVVTLKLSVLLAFLVDLALAVGHNLWAGLFSDSRAIIKLFAYMTPFLAISVLADSVQGVLSSVARGCGVAALGCVRKLEHVLFDQDDNCRCFCTPKYLYTLISVEITQFLC